MREPYNLQRPGSPPPPGNAVLVKVTANATGGGIYAAKICRPPTADVNKNNNLTAGMIAVDGPPCIVCNTKEIGATTHTIAAGTYLVGQVLRINSDGTPVVVVESC